jgi:hypothetical protein
MGVLQQGILEAEERLPKQAEEALHEKLGQSSGIVADPSAQLERGDPGLRAVELANRLRSLSGKQRNERLDELMGWIDSAFQVTSANEVRREYGRLCAVIKRTVEWIMGWPMTCSRVERCQKFVQTVRSFAKRVSNQGNRAGLLRYASLMRSLFSHAPTRLR